MLLIDAQPTALILADGKVTGGRYFYSLAPVSVDGKGGARACSLALIEADRKGGERACQVQLGHVFLRCLLSGSGGQHI